MCDNNFIYTSYEPYILDWLYSELDMNICDETPDLVNQYESKYILETYYSDDSTGMTDIDNMFLSDKLVEVHKYMNPSTNIYHCNSLFRQLLDYSIDNKYDYKVLDNENYRHFNLLDKNMKLSFYKFCYKYS